MSTDKKGVVLVIAGGSDISDPPDMSANSKKIRDWVADKWYKVMGLDPQPNAVWMGNLGGHLKNTLGKDTIIEHIEWSGSAAPWRKKEAIAAMRKQLGDIAKKHPGKEIICIGKSLAGPYMMRALHELKDEVTVTQFISLAAPWGLWDTIPDNVLKTAVITSEKDFFKELGDGTLFGNFVRKSPERPRNKSGVRSDLRVVVEKPNHGQMSHNTETGKIEITGGNFPNALLNSGSMYRLIGGVIGAGLSEYSPAEIHHISS